jgi:hypothetical protein
MPNATSKWFVDLGQGGGFQSLSDFSPLPLPPPAGNYQAYLVVSQAGYRDAQSAPGIYYK